MLKPRGLFAIVNWHQLPREKTTVPGEPRAPRSELRLSPDLTVKAVEATGLETKAIVDISPYLRRDVRESGPVLVLRPVRFSP
ncbi:MAG TPA: hypothetical protein VFL49_13460, partial [Pseudolabrys sp.]|nr:hypothetical protein [Pseudolabrys sp.]